MDAEIQRLSVHCGAAVGGRCIFFIGNFGQKHFLTLRAAEQILRPRTQAVSHRFRQLVSARPQDASRGGEEVYTTVSRLRRSVNGE